MLMKLIYTSVCLQLDTDICTTAAFKKQPENLGTVLESNYISFSELLGPVVSKVEVTSSEHI